MPNLKKYFAFIIDDIILWSYKWMLDFITGTFLKRACIILTLMVVANFILFFMHYIRTWNMNMFFQQILVQLIMLTGLAIFLQLSIAQGDIAAMINFLGLKESLDKLMKNGFLKDAVLMLPMMIFNWFLFVPWFGGTHLHFFLMYLDGYDVPGSVAIRWSYFVMFNSCYATGILFYFLSVCFHADLMVRFRILQQDINNLSEVDVKTPLYQEHVEEVLKSCITQHIFLKRIVKDMKIIRALLLVYSLAGMCLGGNMVAYMFLDISREEKVRLGITFASMTLFVYNLVSISQDFKDESETIYVAATNTPWYQWNKGNCVLLQILLIQSMKPCYVTNGIHPIDYLFLIKLFKGMYTMGMFYHTSLQRRV